MDTTVAGAAELTDPSLADGFRVLYDREVPVEIRQSEDTELDSGDLQAVRMKILAQVDANNRVVAAKLEACAEFDLFFHYHHTFSEAGFKELQSKQKLMIDFADYPNVLIRMCNQCINNPQTHMAVIYMRPNGGLRLDLVQNMEYKFVELLSLDFLQSPPEVTRKQIAFRYNTVKNKARLVQDRLAEVLQLIKLKNPSLLLQIEQKAGVSTRPLTSPSRKTPLQVPFL